MNPFDKKNKRKYPIILPLVVTAAICIPLLPLAARNAENYFGAFLILVMAVVPLALTGLLETMWGKTRDKQHEDDSY